MNFPVHLVLGVEQIFTKGKFKSIDGNNPPFVVVSPVAGFYFKFTNSIGLHLSYSYLPLHAANISPHRVILGIRTSLNIKGSKSDFDNYYIIKK